MSWFCSGFPIARCASVGNDSELIKRIPYDQNGRSPPGCGSTGVTAGDDRLFFFFCG